MARTPRIPMELQERPFSLAEARAAGLTWRSLQGKAWRRLGEGLYCWNGLDEDLWQVLRAWQDSLPEGALFAGATAAWIGGLDFNAIDPVEIVVPRQSGMRSRRGLSVRHCQIPASEAITVRGLRATSLHRSLGDLSRRLPAVEVLVAMDMAIAKGLTNATTLERCAGTRKLRSIAALAAPAESPMETRLRWLLIQRGLPRPEVQVDLRDEEDRFLARADLYYPAARLIVEYDGSNHRDRLVEDNRRQNVLLSAGFQLLRFTAADTRDRQDVVESLVRGALARRPAGVPKA
jgi:very-short-patch-repair endonuclease